MKLLTKQIRDRLARFGSTDSADCEVVVKFFDPYGSWTWWAWEGEPVMGLDGEEDYVFFGLVRGFETEIGSFSLGELESVRSPFGGPRIERDLHFRPTTKSELLRAEGLGYLADTIEGRVGR